MLFKKIIRKQHNTLQLATTATKFFNQEETTCTIYLNTCESNLLCDERCMFSFNLLLESLSINSLEFIITLRIIFLSAAISAEDDESLTLIIGVVVGGFFFLLILSIVCLVICLCCLKSKKKTKDRRYENFYKDFMKPYTYRECLHKRVHGGYWLIKYKIC